MTEPLESLADAAYNPRFISDEARAGLRRSLWVFGDLSGVVYNRATGRLICAHQRKRELAALDISSVRWSKPYAVELGEESARFKSRERDGWAALPGGAKFRIREVEWSSEPFEKAANVAANNALIAGEFTADLAALLEDIKLDLPELSEALRFDDLAVTDPAGKECAPDAIPDPPDDPVTRPGDLWLMGDHRLLCGDSTDRSDRAKAGIPETANVLVYDPPWDAPIRPMSWNTALVFTDGRRTGDAVRLFGQPTWVFVWDCCACWYTPKRPLQRIKLCLWYGETKSYNPDAAHHGDAGDARVVWNSRGSYAYRPDPRGKHLADLYSQSLTRLHSEGIHSHEKPLDWVRMLIGNCTSGDVVDPFLGSGTALIACEQLGRRCYAMEIEPRYVDVAVRRWCEFTGKNATRESDGASWRDLNASPAPEPAHAR